MSARVFAGAAILFVCVLSSTAGGTKAKDDKPAAIPKGALAGKVKAVDVKMNTFTITLDGDEERTFRVDKQTKFWGPRFGLREDGLKDESMGKGYLIHVDAEKDYARAVFLGFKKQKEKKTEKDK